MTNEKGKKRKPLHAERRIYSLKAGLFVLVVVGVLASSLVYILTHAVSNALIETYAVTQDAKTDRRNSYYVSLQKYVAKHNVSIDDLSPVMDWLNQNRYVYLLIYKDDLMIFSSGENKEHIGIGDLPGVGITIEYPTDEELRKQAESQENNLFNLTLSDGTLLCSIAEFTEYMYFDIANISCLLLAVITLALIMIFYFRWIVGRISLLADDVNVVADGNMTHRIHVDSMSDEITDLTKHVEDMRSSIVNTLESEREAIKANNDLISAMSHDIRTPLTVLLGYLDILETMHGAEETEGKYLKAAESTAMRLKNLTDDLFRYFLVYSGKSLPGVQLLPYDAQTLLSQLLSEHILLLTEQGYRWEEVERNELAPGLQILTDPPKLMRIVDNIFSNFGKYADKNEAIRLEKSCDSDYIYLHFSNITDTHGKEVESNGIGLRSSQKIAEALHVGFEMEKDEVSYHVTLRLPLAKADGREGETV